ncbi:MAG: hypothetical protein ACREI3_03460 [Nitrospirales bacterium]
MFQNVDRESIMLGASILAWVAAMLTIVDRLISLRERFGLFKKRPAATEPLPKEKGEAPKRANPVPPDLPSKFGPPLSYLFTHEMLVIGATGLLLNYVGLVISLRLESILYLDMVGTALAAFLLGPWWGATVALLSNSFVNWLLYPEPGGELVIFPWSLVNMAGGVFWGLMARRASFRAYLASPSKSAMVHLWYLTQFGIVGAFVMAVPGTFVQAALAQQSVLALDPLLARSLEQLVARYEGGWQALLTGILGVTWGESLGWGLLNYVQNCLRYIPDKTMSVAIALVVLKFGFPLFERELIHGGPHNEPPRSNRISPLILGLLYVPSFAVLVWADLYAGNRYWGLWTAPWVGILAGYLYLYRHGPSEAAVHQARLDRASRYEQAFKPVEQDPAYLFCRRLTLAILIASAIFVLVLPVLLVDYYRASFTFFCVVYGFLFAVHLVHVAISQNLSVARLRE